MADLTARAHATLARQHGVASIPDLLAASMTRSSINDVVRRGGLELVVPGAYRTPSAPETELQRCAAMSRARPEIAIAGPTAGRLWVMRRIPRDDLVHVIAPRASNPSIEPWVTAFRSPTWSMDDVIERTDGIRVLGRARLVFDLARFVDDLDLMSIIEQVLLDGPCTVDDLRALAEDWESPRRRWIRRVLEVLDRRIDGPPAESHLEVIVGDRLAAAGVLGLVRQYWIRPRGHRPIRFDLAVPAKRWAVEIDGYPTHREIDGARSDRRRDRAAESLGWTVRRIGPTDVRRRSGEVIRFLVDDVDAREAVS